MKPAILMVGSFLSAAGENPAVGESLALRLKATGYKVLATSNKRPRMTRLLDMLSTVWTRRSEYQLACVEVYSGPAFLWAEAVSRLLVILRKPFILALHGGNLPNFAQTHRRRVIHLLKPAAAVVAPSRYLLMQMSPFRSDIQLIPNTLDIAVYPFRLRANPAPRLVWLRAFHSMYNPLLALRAVAELGKFLPEITLEMIGPDKGDGSLLAAKSLCTELGIEGHVQFTGGISKSIVPVRLTQADIFLNTTNIDNTPVSVMEAMACGLCVISTNVGGLPYLVQHGQDGLLVPPDDPGSFAAAIRRILTTPGLAARLSGAARRKAEKFDGGYVLPQWENLINSVRND